LTPEHYDTLTPDERDVMFEAFNEYMEDRQKDNGE
jgi:hypothetical protein